MGFGLMMSSPLTVTSILRHATTFHAGAEIISRTANGGVHRYTYADFSRRVQQLANALTARGVRPGDRVATLAWNGYRHMELYYAVSCLGAVCHTINPRLFRDQVAYIANHAGDTHLFFEIHFAELVESLRDDLVSVRGYVALCDHETLPTLELRNLIDYESLIAGQPETFSWPEFDERTASALCYTSGTTGNPKGVLYSHRSTLIHALSISGGDWLGIRARDSILPVVPMFHANAWGIPYAALMNGAKLVLPGHALDGSSLHELIETERVTLMAGVPTVWMELLRHLKATRGGLDSVERMMVGGSAAPHAMIKTFEEDYDVRVIHGWGMTELSPVGTLCSLKAHELERPPEERYELQTRQGRPLFGVDMRIVDDAGSELPHDGIRTGMLQVRGPWIASGYYKGEAPEQFTAEGWFGTGDVAAIDADGYLRITDRAKDVIKSGGEWISSIELENIAMSHPAVAEAACIAVPHSRWGERPIVCVVAHDNQAVDPQEILALYEGKIAKWWMPDAVEVVRELPHTATGKLQKLELRRRYEDYRLPTDKVATQG